MLDRTVGQLLIALNVIILLVLLFNKSPECASQTRQQSYESDPGLEKIMTSFESKIDKIRVGDSCPKCPKTESLYQNSTLSDEEMKSIFLQLIEEINLRVIRNQGGCTVKRYGVGYGSHHLCDLSYQHPCYFYSFGIENDYSFDVDFSQSTGCSGIGLDPTVSYARLSDKVFFLEMGHKSLEPPEPNWLVTSAPELRKMFNHEKIAALKMDCEGCEYSIAKDVLENDPEFFSFVDQFTIEIHVTNWFVKSPQHLHNYALLYKLLKQKGLRLVGGELTSCGAKEAYGCPDYLKNLGYPCGKDNLCQNFLFARV